MIISRPCHWIVTPLCLCTDVLPVWLPYEGNNYTVYSAIFPDTLSWLNAVTRTQFCAYAAIYPRFLVWVGLNSHSGYNISYTLPDELSHRIRVLDVILRGYPECIPVAWSKQSWHFEKLNSSDSMFFQREYYSQCGVRTSVAFPQICFVIWGKHYQSSTNTLTVVLALEKHWTTAVQLF